MKSKACTKCNEVKKLSEFHNRSDSKDGKRVQCRMCRNAVSRNDKTRARDRARYQKNKKEILEKARTCYNNDAEWATIKKDSSSRYYYTNRAQINAKAKKRNQEDPSKARNYRRKNKEKRSNSFKEWSRLNQEKLREKGNRRRCKERNGSSSLSIAEIDIMRDFAELALILTEETGICYHVDHPTPISRGGLHHPDNMRVITAEQNLRKGNKLDSELDFEIKEVGLEWLEWYYTEEETV